MGPVNDNQTILTLTEEQLAVASHPLPGHGRVLAGPGTGKSTAAVALAEKLHEQERRPRIRFLTFTRAATAELAKKLSGSQARTFDRPSTIHSFSISALLQNPRSASFPNPLRLPDDHEFKVLIRPHLARRTHVRVKQLDNLVNEMAAKWESLAPVPHPRVTPEERARFMGAFLQHRKIFGYTLLQELPDLFRCALRDHEDLVGTDYDLLIVDEYQDLNACDLEVLRRLTQRGSSLLSIGDDDQSIYSFRKAHPAGIRAFLQEYPGAQDYTLSICQRLPRAIIEWSQYVIQGDIDRQRPRDPLQFREGNPEGLVALLNFRSDRREAIGVADLVVWLRETQGVPDSEILILSRTDRHGKFSEPIKEELRRRAIQVSEAGVIEEILGEPSNRRLLGVLRLSVDQGDSLAWWTLINLHPRLGPTFVDYVFDTADAANATFGETFRQEAANDFADCPPTLRGQASQLWNEISRVTAAVSLPTENTAMRWGQWIADEIVAGHLPQCSDSFRDLLLKMDGIVEEGRDLGRFLSQIQPLGEDIMRTESHGVRFMTMSASKGLTVEATIVVGVDNDLIPRPDQNFSEERRLLYVAMTRSRRFLLMTWANRRQGPPARSGNPNIGRRQPSDFLRGGPIESQDGAAFINGLRGR